MGEKVMVDFPAFLTRDSETRHLLVGDDSHVLLGNSIIAELYNQLFNAVGYEETGRIIYESARRGTYRSQKDLIKAYRISLKNEEELTSRIARFPLYIQTYGHGKGKTVKKGEEPVFSVENSSVAQYLKSTGLGKTVCFFLAGFFAGMAEAYAELLEPSRTYKCVETACIARGDARCEFRLTPQKTEQL